MATAQTFIALCSMRYFLSSRCGRDWGAFAERLDQHADSADAPASNLIALRWADDGPRAQPPMVGGAEVVMHATPYAEEIRELVKIRSHRVEYEAFLDALADRIVTAAHRFPLRPAELARMRAALDAFQDHPARGSGPGRSARVSFAVITGTKEQMSAVRSNVNSYGKRREDWAPYEPRTRQPVMDRAAEVAASRRLRSESVALDSLGDRLAAAGEHNEIVVLLVDAWATQLNELRATLRAASEQDDRTAAVLVPVNFEDPETEANSGMLRVEVLSVFRDRSRRHDLMFYPEVSTAERFDADLAVAIVEAENRLQRADAEAERTSGRSSSGRPILGGP
ncbi:FxsC protein [Paractinoplanes tereljensis]|uniref:FxsC protein n=1 Tax=Paractinoplanes tereljensis TaxID=571912 RepID=UPI001940FE6F|nr:FxsC protein [Actinoplanes tereljensis]